MSPETTALLPFWLTLMAVGFPAAGIAVVYRHMRNKSKQKPTTGRHARPSQINGTAYPRAKTLENQSA